MGIVINRQVIHGIAFEGKPLVGIAYKGKIVWQSTVSRIKFDPAFIVLANNEYQNIKNFAVKSTMSWEIEELL